MNTYEVSFSKVAENTKPAMRVLSGGLTRHYAIEVIANTLHEGGRVEDVKFGGEQVSPLHRAHLMCLAELWTALDKLEVVHDHSNKAA